MRFRKGNRHKCGQDFSWSYDIPHGVDFNVRCLGPYLKLYELTGFGYGLLGLGTEAYGNGSIHLSWDLMTPSLRRRVTVAVKE